MRFCGSRRLGVRSLRLLLFLPYLWLRTLRRNMLRLRSVRIYATRLGSFLLGLRSWPRRLDMLRLCALWWRSRAFLRMRLRPWLRLAVRAGANSLISTLRLRRRLVVFRNCWIAALLIVGQLGRGPRRALRLR